MKIGILGSGSVGQALSEGFKKSGYEVMVSSRQPEKLGEFAEKAGVQKGIYEEAAKFGELIVLCVKGDAVEQAIRAAGGKNFENFRGKIVIDVTNPLKMAEGKPPSMFAGYPDSLGARVQKLLPESKVVKAFNMSPAHYMADARKAGDPDLLICGNDGEAKKKVAGIAREWGWKVSDLGGIENAYLLEATAMVWITYGMRNNHWTHAFKILNRKE